MNFPSHCQCGCGGKVRKNSRFLVGHNKKKVNSQETFFDRILKEEGGCWLWQGSISKAGYGTLSYHGKVSYAHRLSYIFVNGPIPDGLHVLHKCDNPPCCNPDHLFLGTHLDNIADMKSKLRCAYGEKSATAKLTELQVAEIREAYVPRIKGLSKQLAKKYGISSSHVPYVANGGNGKKLCWPLINKKIVRAI